jgi:ABC-type branched-subunit amino acid transport system substrate-binding protein
MLFATHAYAQVDTRAAIRVAQSAALSGLQAEVGIAFNEGAKAAFEEANRAGGVHGRKIEFVSADDGYDAQKAVENTRRFLGDGAGPLVLFGYTGTPATSAVIPLLDEANIVLFAPITGSDGLQAKGHPNIFFLRGTYSDEIRKIIQHLATIGLTRVAVFYQDDGFGKGGLAIAKQLMESLKLPAPLEVPYDPRSDDLQPAAKKITEAAPQAVIHLASARFSGKLLNALGLRTQAIFNYGVSIISAPDLIREAGSRAHGFVIAQRVPNPLGVTSVATSFRRDMQAQGLDSTRLTYPAMEGYLAAKVLIHALRDAGPAPTRASVRAALGRIKDYEMGPMHLSYAGGQNRGARFVDLALVRSDLTMVR